MKFIYAFFTLILMPMVVSAGDITGKVTKVTTHLNVWNVLDYNQKSTAHIYINGLPNACGTGYKRVAISSDNPLFKTFITMALTAQATGKSVTTKYLDTCTVRSNSWDLVILETESN